MILNFEIQGVTDSAVEYVRFCIPFFHEYFFWDFWDQNFSVLKTKTLKSSGYFLMPSNKLFEYCFKVRNCSVLRSDRGKKQQSNIFKKQYYPSFPLQKLQLSIIVVKSRKKNTDHIIDICFGSTFRVLFSQQFVTDKLEGGLGP